MVGADGPPGHRPRLRSAHRLRAAPAQVVSLVTGAEARDYPGRPMPLKGASRERQRRCRRGPGGPADAEPRRRQRTWPHLQGHRWHLDGNHPRRLQDESPAGPVVPLPQHRAASPRSTDGTTTVFAKGKMIAIKGSHYSRSNGDEAGAAGGVKSSVNMKATDWITYSFDVKMDGKNACLTPTRNSTTIRIPSTSGGNLDPRTKTDDEGNLVVFCAGAPKVVSARTGKKRKAYNDCELEEICAKIAYYNRKIKESDGAGTPFSGRRVMRADATGATRHAAGSSGMHLRVRAPTGRASRRI